MPHPHVNTIGEFEHFAQKQGSSYQAKGKSSYYVPAWFFPHGCPRSLDVRTQSLRDWIIVYNTNGV